MSVRDPNTGQFLPAGADRTVDAAYEDFDIQQVRLVLEFDATTAGQNGVLDSFHISEPLGGLQRDELAELVGLSTRVSHLAARDSGDGAVNQTFSGELSFDAESHMTDPDDSVVTEDVDPEVDRAVWELESDPDVLDHWAVEGIEQHDSVNGQASNFSTVYDRTYQYRPMFGRGPVLDRHNDLFWHLRYNLGGNLDAAGAMSWNTTLVWDVFARGQG